MNGVGESSLIIPTSIIKTIRWRAVSDFVGNDEDELHIRRGENVEVLSKDPKISGKKDWWTGKIGDDRIGIFPNKIIVQDDLGVLLQSVQDPPFIEETEIKLDIVIGVGGFAKVMHGFWKEQEVAVKIPTLEEELLEEEVRLITNNAKQEGKVFWLLKHPNIISLFGVSEGRKMYKNIPRPLSLIMEYAVGGSLSNYLLQKKSITNSKLLLKWSIQVCHAMCYIHYDAPITLVHRDLKSSNVLLCCTHPIDTNNENDLMDVTIKISDFGLARALKNNSRMSNAGTLPWMAPEVIKNSSFSKASDVWSFGCLVWEMLTGEIPHQGIDSYVLQYGIAVNKLQLPIPSSCPQEWSEIMESCWRIEPSTRPEFPALRKDLMKELQAEEEFEEMEERKTNQKLAKMQETWKSEIYSKLQDILVTESKMRNTNILLSTHV